MIEKRRRDFAGAKFRVIDDVFDERDVGGDAANAKFAQRAIHAIAGFVEMLAPSGDFDEQRIVIGGENRACVSGAAVETDAESRGRAIRRNFSVVGREIVLRIFGGDAALQRGAVERDIFLARQRHRRFVQFVALRHQNLRLHEVDAGHHFGDGVLDLNARIDLDEVNLLLIDVVEKFNGASIAVVRFARELHRCVAKFVANVRRKIRRRRDLDDFLMAALHGAVALVQMQQVAVRVAENLHFEMARARQIFFEEAARIAKRRLCFALRFFERGGELRFVAHDAHAASAAAERGFYDDRIADLFRDALALLRATGRDLRCRAASERRPTQPVSARQFCRRATPANSASDQRNVMPAFSQARANAGFSERNP